MSIPIERRELQDGWVLTCRSKDGGDLRLSDLSVLRENLLVSILGGENVFHTSSGKEFIGSPRKKLPVTFDTELTDDEDEDDSVLDEIRDMILSSQDHGSWTVGMGGLKGVSNIMLRATTESSSSIHTCDNNLSPELSSSLATLFQRNATTTIRPPHVRQSQDFNR